MREQPWRSVWERLRFLRWPLLRGAVILLESVINGMSALTFSAQQQEQDAPSAGTEAETAGGADPQPAGGRGRTSRGEQDATSPAALTGVIVLSVALALVIFVGLPHLLTWLVGLQTDSLAFHLVDGAFKVAILVGYIAAIGLNKEIRRVFMYHGAEHKAIWAYEKELELTVKNVRPQSRFHPRCGTSFLVVVILVSIFLFALLLQHPISDSGALDHLLKILIKVPLMLPVAGLAYEGIKLSGRFREHLALRWLIAPGMWLQRLTTREPTDDQLEIGILALRKTLWREAVEERSSPSGIRVYQSFAEALPATET